MTWYLVQPTERIFVKGYNFLSFAKNMGKNIGKVKTWAVNIARSFLIMLNNLQQMQLKLVSKRVIQKTAEATGDLIGNKIADKITKI